MTQVDDFRTLNGDAVRKLLLLVRHLVFRAGDQDCGMFGGDSLGSLGRCHFANLSPTRDKAPRRSRGRSSNKYRHTIDLNVAHGGDVADGAIDPMGKFLLLSFLIDIRPNFHYAASLDGGPTREVVTSDGIDNFTVLFSRDLLGAGRHRVTVTEIEPGSGKAGRSFDFALQL